ncbi:MAG: HD domain-containing protein [Campylobacterales bacterium]|nr:HD domain-containing protein [Campylobacterales bacterium]
MKQLAFLKEHSPSMFEHSVRTAAISHDIAKSLELSVEEKDWCFYGGLVHDIGKSHIPNEYLSTGEKLNYATYEIVKNHVILGIRMLHEDVPEYIKESVTYHHERFDGRGYPYGIKGSEIPLHVRIISVADAFDAMTSNRQYQSNKTHEMALIEILNNSGTQFCPNVVSGLMHAVENLKLTRHALIENLLCLPQYNGLRELYTENAS